MTTNFRIAFLILSIPIMVSCSTNTDYDSYIPEINGGTKENDSLQFPVLDFEPEEAYLYMVNPNATLETTSLFYNLKSISQTRIILGQQDAFSSFYMNNAGDSDIKKLTGSNPGLLGSDFMFITDDLNDGSMSNWYFQQENQIRHNVIEAFDMGLVNVFCWHLREPFEGKVFYTDEMSQFQKENALKSIFPGGENHAYYRQKLEKIASFSKSLVNAEGLTVPIIFRPFHEFDGDWFWWGAPYSSIDEYIQLWQFTISYLTRDLMVDNLLFAFSPDNTFNSEGDYLQRYPGDDFVDILGMDKYGDFMAQNSQDIESASQKLQIISHLSETKNKIAALTETGFAFNLDEHNVISDYYTNKLYKAIVGEDINIAFIMFWFNSQNSYYTPLPGLEGSTDFIKFVSMPEILLADELPDMYNLSNGF